MENASKALLIAGGVLIVMLLLSLFSYLMTNVGGYAKNTYARLSETSISEFNQQFLNYAGRGYNDRPSLTIQDVISIVNLAKDYNEKNYYNGNTVDKIEVEVITNSGMTVAYWEMCNTNELNKKMEYYLNAKFGCKDDGVKINKNSLLVDKVTIIGP